jgi:Lipase (class 3)
LPTTFDFPLAERLARASDFAYHRDFTHQAELDGAVHTPIDQGTSHVSVLAIDNTVLVAFRGTQPNVPDWIKNFKVHLVGFTLPGIAALVPGQVHDGFLKELQACWPALLACVRPLISGNRPLYITGHSQGAAIAVLATAAFKAAAITVTATYTFAAPRPGDAKFGAYLADQTIHRVELGDDIVPHVPPTIPPKLADALKLVMMGAPAPSKRLLSLVNAGYVSVGSLAYGQMGEFVVPEMTSAQEKHLFDSRLRRLFTAGNSVVTDHDVNNYVNAVNKY